MLFVRDTPPLSQTFFEKPILNSPYAYPGQHWELLDGQPTNQIIPSRRRSDFYSPVPKPKKQRQNSKQSSLTFQDAQGITSDEQEYNPTPIINEIRTYVEKWRSLPNPNDWGVTPETARLLQHWRHHKFNGVRPFFCQVEAVETAIWLAEVAPKMGVAAQKFAEHLKLANAQANPELIRTALKLATGAGQDLNLRPSGYEPLLSRRRLSFDFNRLRNNPLNCRRFLAASRRNQPQRTGPNGERGS